MFEVTHEELNSLMSQCYKTKTPMFVWGATGIGKSRVAKDFSKANKLEFIDVRLSQLDPSDLRGLPTFKDDKTKWSPPNWLPEKGNGILFLDEVNLAPPSMQASAYELVLDRKIGDYKLPDGWVVFAAGNRLEDKAHTFEIPAPLCNRFAHIELKIPKVNPDKIDEGWTGWAMKNNIDMRIINFLTKHTSMLFKFDSSLKDKAFPTPRSYEMLSVLMRDIDSDNLPLIQMLASSTIGQGTAVEFSAFLKFGRGINLTEIFANPNKVKELKDVDMKYALVNELTNYYQNRKDNKSFVSKIPPILENLEPEFSIRLLMMCLSIGGQNFTKALVNEKGSDKVITKYAKYLYV